MALSDVRTWCQICAVWHVSHAAPVGMHLRHGLVTSLSLPRCTTAESMPRFAAYMVGHPPPSQSQQKEIYRVDQKSVLQPSALPGNRGRRARLALHRRTNSTGTFGVGGICLALSFAMLHIMGEIMSRCDKSVQSDPGSRSIPWRTDMAGSARRDGCAPTAGNQSGNCGSCFPVCHPGPTWYFVLPSQASPYPATLCIKLQFSLLPRLPAN